MWYQLRFLYAPAATHGGTNGDRPGAGLKDDQCACRPKWHTSCLCLYKKGEDSMTQPILEHFGQVFHHEDPMPTPRGPRTGRCIVVTTGSREPQMLSANALNAIRAATLLLVDDQVSGSVVALAPPGTRVVHVSTRNGGLASPPAFVEKLIAMAVGEGEQVVHLQANASCQ